MFLTDHHRHRGPPAPDDGHLLLSFESALRRRLRSLELHPPLSLRHLSLAASAAASTLRDASPFLHSRVHPSAALLDSCNSATSVVRHILLSRLPLLHAIRLLASPGPKALSAAAASLSDWCRDDRRPPVDIRVPDLPADGSAICAAEAVSFLALSAIAGALARAPPAEVRVPEGMGWVEEFEEASAMLHDAVRRGEVEEVEAVREAVGRLRKAIGSGVEVRESAEALEKATARLTAGLEELASALEGMFRTAMGTRNAGLDRLRRGACRYE